MSLARIDPGPPYPRRWFYGLRWLDLLIYRVTWTAITVILKGPVRLKGFGHRSLPQDGPMLLLSNHLTVMDPFMAGWLPYRPSRFMASAQPLKTPFLGAWLKSLGAFPKKKFVKDRGSMTVLQEFYDNGQQIMIFPEGSRAWDGRQMPIGEGIGRLVKRLGSGVTISRMTSAYYFWPRWAKYPRFVPMHIEYEGPYRWPESATPAEITREIAELLDCEQKIPEGYLTWGFRTAHGLSAYLWACPHCFALDGLDVAAHDGNRIQCGTCNATWKVALDTTLEPDADNHPRLTVAEAYDRIDAHFTERPVQDAARFEAEGIAFEGEDGVLLKARTGARGFDVVAEGPLVLDGRGLSVDGTTRLEFDELKAVSVELGNKVQLRTNDRLYRLVPESGSVLRWGHFIHRWRCSVQGLPHTPLG